jgi:hypothetical protein
MECAYRYALVTSEKELKSLLKKLRLPQVEFCDDGALAQTHVFREEGYCLVLLKEGLVLRAEEILGLLVHEAVHVWQFHCEWIGEDKPGTEAQAYGIQKIATELFKAYSQSIPTEHKESNAEITQSSFSQ